MKFQVKYLYFSILAVLLFLPSIFLYLTNGTKSPVLLVNNALIIGFIVLFAKFSLTRIFSFFLLLIYVVNNGLDTFSLFYYKMNFNLTMAMSFLSTTGQEAKEMAGSYIGAIFLAFILFGLLFIFIHRVKKYIPKWVVISWSVLFSLVFIIGHLTKESSEKASFKLTEIPFIGIMAKSPVSNLATFLVADHMLEEARASLDEDYDYPFFEVQNLRGIKNLVVVIGESARRDALSLYGNKYETSPFMDKRKDNLLIYTNGIAPASFTNAAVSLILSKQIPGDDFSVKKNQDNVISLANASEYWTTYWLSNQEQSGIFMNAFSNIIHKAKYQTWVEDTSYDMGLIPLLEKSLKDSKENRLIFLHLAGSHQDTKDRYPSSFEVEFDTGNTAVDSYYKSIAYTDLVLENVIRLIEDEKSVVIYLSDHGESFVKGEFRHSLTKKGLEIPFFIWYSDDLLEDTKLGIDETYMSSTNLYNMLNDLMGVKGLEKKDENIDLKVLTPSLKMTFYNNLDEGE